MQKMGWETTKGKMNVYPSHSGTIMQVQETYVKVATRLCNSRRVNVTPCLLLETKALHEILNLWGRRGVRKASTHLFFPSSLLLIHEFQEIQPLRLRWPHVGSIYLMADFAVPVTSLPIYYHFVKHTLILFPSLSFSWQYTKNKNILVVKKIKT